MSRRPQAVEPSSVAHLREAVRSAASGRTPLRLRGSGSKDFYGGMPLGEQLDTRAHSGVIGYDPTELVLTARCGTRLAEIEALLAERGQMLAFEPPHFGPDATLGGCVASGLSGPRRASNGLYFGAVRDHMLGCRILDGNGQILSFGGEVMKNVAGYDVSRLMAGAMGTLGVILEVSLKVLPRPAAEATLRFSATEQEALDRLNEWGGKPLPVSASAWRDGVLHVRLEGAAAAVESALRALGGELVNEMAARAFWIGVREQTDAFFAGDRMLWRASLPSVAQRLELAGEQFIEWGGALRWLRSDAEPERVRAAVRRAGGHATAFRSADRARPFEPLEPVQEVLHRRLKAVFDPLGILNPGRLHPDW